MIFRVMAFSINTVEGKGWGVGVIYMKNNAMLFST